MGKHRNRERSRSHSKDAKKRKNRSRSNSKDRKKKQTEKNDRKRRSSSKSSSSSRGRSQSKDRKRNKKHSKKSISKEKRSKNNQDRKPESEKKREPQNKPDAPNIIDKNDEIHKKINNESNNVPDPKKNQEDLKDLEKHEPKLEPMAEEKILSPEEMMKLMGFANFASTKGASHKECTVEAVAKNSKMKRKYRQYMNRKGGFNKPLDSI